MEVIEMALKYLNSVQIIHKKTHVYIELYIFIYII